MATLRIFGNGLSQPARAGGTRNDAFKAINPAQLVPAIVDDGFALGEGHAIMTYLADKHGWTDVYPSDLRTRARVNQYLHWHHGGTRQLVRVLFFPYITSVKGGSIPDDLQAKMDKGRKTAGRIVGIVETYLQSRPFLVSNEPTIADISCYTELYQLQAMNLFDFTPYPRTLEWLEAMKTLPHHDEANAVLHDIVKVMNRVNKEPPPPFLNRGYLGRYCRASPKLFQRHPRFRPAPSTAPSPPSSLLLAPPPSPSPRP